MGDGEGVAERGDDILRRAFRRTGTEPIAEIETGHAGLAAAVAGNPGAANHRFFDVTA